MTQYLHPDGSVADVPSSAGAVPLHETSDKPSSPPDDKWYDMSTEVERRLPYRLGDTVYRLHTKEPAVIHDIIIGDGSDIRYVLDYLQPVRGQVVYHAGEMGDFWSRRP